MSTARWNVTFVQSVYNIVRLVAILAALPPATGFAVIIAQPMIADAGHCVYCDYSFLYDFSEGLQAWLNYVLG
ncbi:hypothetical protein GCM10022405_05700 [Gibbsiella dentisursi]|uniref:Uncharacterized protein n=1 Tax=Gibbsiella dentisursi TaxID=796890 RepID=A0ABP7KQN7_9GAMM